MIKYLSSNHWIFNAVKPLDSAAAEQAQSHQNTLTKPPGSLGLLETLAIKFAACQGQKKPLLNEICVRVFAADHGVCDKGVSAFDQAVTAAMIANFASGGAAISVLSRIIEADFAVVNLGTVSAVELPSAPTHSKPQATIIDAYIADKTQDFSEYPAMTNEQLTLALAAGKREIDNRQMDLFIGGEMGIGNTTSASALYGALLGLDASKTVGPGTGVDQAGVEHKQNVVRQALHLHANILDDPIAVLACLGGFEIAALCGSYMACAQRGVPVVVDGFISTAAALVAAKINPRIVDWFIFSHCSAEPAHRLALDFFQAEPLIDFSMRLGEGSAAALVVPLIQSALKLHNEMASFSEAGIIS